MAAICEVVQAFLREMEWNWEQIDEHRLRVLINGEAGQWTWLACWNKDDTLFGSYSICPFNVPAKRRLAVAEFLTMANYGLSLGNFELDLRDGEVRFKTSTPVQEGRLSREMVRELAFCGFSLMDRYTPSLMTVAFGKVSPRKAIQQAEPPAKPEPPSQNDQENPARRSAADLYSDRATRVAQIADRLRMMKDRVINEAKGHCFILLENCPPPPKGEGRGKAASSAPLARRERMVQLYFREDWFAIDIPNTYIVPAEACKLLGERQGFYREAETPDAGVSDVVHVVNYDPVGKRYTYGQEQDAAEDAAWIFFDLWSLDPSRPIYVSAASFKSGHQWEQQQLLE